MRTALITYMSSSHHGGPRFVWTDVSGLFCTAHLLSLCVTPDEPGVHPPLKRVPRPRHRAYLCAARASLAPPRHSLMTALMRWAASGPARASGSSCTANKRRYITLCVRLRRGAVTTTPSTRGVFNGLATCRLLGPVGAARRACERPGARLLGLAQSLRISTPSASPTAGRRSAGASASAISARGVTRCCTIRSTPTRAIR